MAAQLRLIPDALSPHRLAARKSARAARAVAKYGPGEGRSHRAIAAMHGVINTAVIRGMSGKN